MRLSTSSVLSALAIIPMAMGAALPDNAEVAPVDNPLVERTIEKRVFEGKCDPQQWGWCQLVTSHHWTDSNNVFVRAFGHDCHEIGGTWTSNGLGGKSFSTGLGPWVSFNSDGKEFHYDGRLTKMEWGHCYKCGSMGLYRCCAVNFVC